MNNGIKIASIESAEVLKLKEGREADIKYNCVFPNSLLMDKIKEIGLNISKQGSTKDIINVKFSYGYKSLEADSLVKEYKSFKKASKKSNSNMNKIDKDLNNKKEQLLKAKTDKRKDKLNKQIKELEFELAINYYTKNIELDFLEENEESLNDNIVKKDALRDLLYKEGFSLDTYKTVKGEKVFDKTITYKFFFRTAGKAKQGADYFINTDLYNKIDEWQRMGIKLPDTNAKLVEMEVYKSLVSSSATDDYITIKPSEILVANDLDCYTELQDVVKVIRNKDTGLSEAVHTKEKCKNTIWDGMCLLQGGKGFRGLRHHFYKSAGFCCDFQQYFKDFYKDEYETAIIIDRYGREVKVSTIKMITTENTMKWEKLIGATKESFEYWSNWVEENGCKFGVCKRDHASKYGSKQRASYQMVNTLPITKDDVQELFAETKEYVTGLQNKNEVFLKHLKLTASDINNNMLLWDLATTYPNFVNSHFFKDARKQEINKYKETLKRSKLLFEGDNETIIGNPYMLLEYVTGQLDGYIKDGVIFGYIDKTLPDKNNCYCRRFKDGEEIGAFRSPHNSMNNIMYFKNHISSEMDKYFSGFGDNVIVANMLYTDIQDRGNGLDEDTDFLFCSNTKLVVEACKKAQSYLTIINGFKPNPKTYNNTMEDLAIVDNGLQNSQKAIGESSNVAQLYLSQYWNRVYNVNNIAIYSDVDMEYIEYLNKNNEKLLDNVCILSVLAQVAVDSCKKAFEVGNSENGLNEEINRLRKELPANLKPTFWQYTSSAFKNDKIEKKLKIKDKELWNKLSKKERQEAIKKEKENMISKLINFDCPANWILKEINKLGKAKYKNPIQDENFLVKWGSKKTQDRKQATKIEQLVEDLNDVVSFINTEDGMEDDDNMYYYNFLYKEYMDKIIKLTIKQDTMSLLIIRALDKDNKFLKSNKQIKTKLLNMLYKYNRDNFIKCFIA